MIQMTVNKQPLQMTVNKQPFHGIQKGKDSDSKVRDYVVKYENGKPSQVIGWHFKTTNFDDNLANTIKKYGEEGNKDFVTSADGKRMFIFYKIDEKEKAIVLRNMQEQEKREKNLQFTNAKTD